MSDNRTFVIVGASLAGAKAAEALRDGGFAPPTGLLLPRTRADPDIGGDQRGAQAR